MKLEVRVAGGNQFEVDLDSSCTIADAKVTFQSGCGVDSESMRVILSGRILKDDSTLESCGIDGTQPIHIARGRPQSASSQGPAPNLDGNGAKHSNDNKFGVLVRGPSGAYETKLSFDEQLDSIRGNLAKHFGLNAEQALLLHKGRILRDRNNQMRSLAACGVAEGDTLHIVQSAVQRATDQVEVKESLKILALHGYVGTAKDFEETTDWFSKGLGPRVQWRFLTAPLPGAAVVNNDEDNRAWWPHDSGEDAAAAGWAEAVAYVQGIWEAEGPFDGVVGFSQGAAMAASLAGMQQAGALPFKFSFIISGGGYKCEPASSFFAQGATINIPSIHVVGKHDKLSPPETSHELASCFVNAQVLIHDGGHEFMPRTYANMRILADFFSQFLSSPGLLSGVSVGTVLCKECGNWVPPAESEEHDGFSYCKQCLIAWNEYLRQEAEKKQREESGRQQAEAYLQALRTQIETENQCNSMPSTSDSMPPHAQAAIEALRAQLHGGQAAPPILRDQPSDDNDDQLQIALALSLSGDAEAEVQKCAQCGNFSAGRLDDKTWYCNSCWADWEKKQCSVCQAKRSPHDGFDVDAETVMRLRNIVLAGQSPSHQFAMDAAVRGNQWVCSTCICRM
eukprot:gnl/MRDRNA2_/MRDRNA2_166912_c0_seq1.p1 gnl/MRDRNA2_/MRDRNA2_166912_c0~~gnl/MRDRNA2_/MRDRNA2_166912_c0_seq1.p1  ORF type:complete len:622 (-),score=126.82 gnl/MRDRNA2_/MRDRNA2_166912_c0_seq1:193-2058(-)